MAGEKSGRWFLELILNGILLAGVSYVTFAARGEQERGLAVPLFAAVSPSVNRPAEAAPASTSPADRPASSPGAAASDLQSFSQAWGALQIWAAGLDGKITGDELNSIESSVSGTWKGTQGVRSYLKSVNDHINSGQADQVIHEALSSLAQQANDKKLQVLSSLSDLLHKNGVSLDKIKQIISQWVSQVLKMTPDTLKSFHF